MFNRKHIITLLIVSNLITLCVLVALSGHYRVPQKIYQVLAKEARIPLLTPNHEINRNYAADRQLFNSYPTEGIKTLVLGDSQVSKVNWNELLIGFNAVGRGIDGDTAAGLAARITDYRDTHPEVCIIIIGTNDIWKNRPNTETDNAYRNLIKIALNMWPDTKIVLVSVPPFANWVTDSESKNHRINKANSMIANLADESSRTRYLNFHDSIIDSNKYLAREMTIDGVHLNAAAYKILQNKLKLLRTTE